MHTRYLTPKLPRCLLLCQVVVTISSLSKPPANQKSEKNYWPTYDPVIPVDTCTYKNFASAEEWTAVLSIPCNSWIFYTRVRAVYHDSRAIKYVFFVLWLATLAILGVPFTVKLTSTPLGSDKCLTIDYSYRRCLSIISLFALTLFDTAVMVAISVRTVSYNVEGSWKSSLCCLIFGNEMGHTSRVFLKSSQVYYL